MDVAKYIGLFLLKHNKCYVNGLGTLELKSKPATYDGESLHGPIKEILLSTNGNVDESLANFIATNEQISISKASKALTEFSEKTKDQIASGNTVAIPSLGKLAEEGGKAYFITAPQLQFRSAAIKAPKSPAKRAEANDGGISLPQSAPIPQQPIAPAYQQQQHQQPTPGPSMPESYQDEAETGTKLNWTRIILVLLILILLAAATFIGWKFYNEVNKLNNTPPPPPPKEQIEEALPIEESMPSLLDDTTATDSTDLELVNEEQEVNADNDLPVVDATPVLLKFKVILNTYDNKARANKRYRQLKSYGNTVEVIKEDTNYYFVAMPISASPSDTSRVLDSLSRNFNPSGVFIY